MNEEEVVPQVLDLDNRATEWIKSAWRDGLSLARAVSTRLDIATWEVFAVTGEASKQRLEVHDLRYGGLPRTNSFAGLAAELHRRFESHRLIVELALARPGDPRQLSSSGERVSCGDEVYEVISVGSNLNSVERTLRATDPAGVYNAFVVTSPTDISSCPTVLFEQGEISICGAIAGAYDGEGFIFATSI